MDVHEKYIFYVGTARGVIGSNFSKAFPSKTRFNYLYLQPQNVRRTRRLVFK